MLAALLARLMPYRFLAVCALVGVLALAVYTQTTRLDAAQAAVQTKQTVLEATQRQLADQNAAIEALRAESARRLDIANKATTQATRTAARADARAAAIKAAPVPATCSGALQWLVDQGNKLEGGDQ